jgi:hypothetical protein
MELKFFEQKWKFFVIVFIADSQRDRLVLSSRFHKNML